MSDSGTVASECDKLSKRRRRARHGTCDGESLVKPLDRNASDTLLLTQDAQGGPIHSDDAEQKPVKKRKRNQRVDQAPDERESTVAIPTGTTDREQLDTERFEFNFMQGKEANAAKRAKRKKTKKSINGSAGKMEDVIVRPVLGQKEALEYLHTWHADKESWSFKKKAQYWLLQNIYKKEMICKSDFKILLLYLGSMQGNQRQLTIDRAREVLDSYVEGSEGTQSQGLSKTAYKRAREVLRMLS